MSTIGADSDRGYGEKPWRDESILRELYVSEEMSTLEIADFLDCGETTVLTWMDKFGIERTTPGEPITSELLRDEDWLRELYVGQECTLSEIGEKIGCTGQAVSNWLEKHGIERRNGGYCGDYEKLRDKELLQRLYVEEKKSTTEIASEIGCGHRAVCHWLDQHGIETRGHAVYGKDHPRWNGGSGLYHSVRTWISSENWNDISVRIRERDGHECKLCGEKCTGAAHHIVPVLMGGIHADELLITLCQSCHNKVEAYTRSIPEIEPLLVDWTDEELPDGRERWTPPEDPTPTTNQSTFAAFADD